MKKYFICSDLHGVNPKVLKSSLNKKGFVLENENHILIVLGDITDGLGNESSLINFLRSLQDKQKLLVIKGNHDVWDGYYMPMNDVDLLFQEDLQWLENLPYFIEHPKFNLAHGIYLPKNIRKKLITPELSSLWASPCLLEEGKWYKTPKEDKHTIKSWAPSLKSYVDLLTKPTFVGHFTKDAVKKHLTKTGLLGITAQGFYHIDNKLFFIDGGVLHNQNHVSIMLYEPN